MDCPDSTTVAYVSFGGLNFASIILGSMFAVMYFKDPLLSASPGKLIASMEVCQVLVQVGYVSAIPGFKPFFSESKTLCNISAVLQVSTVIAVWAYSICVNLEVLLKIQRTNKSGAVLPHWIYHTFSLSLWFLNAMIMVFCSDAIYDANFGCTFLVENLVL